MNKFTPEEVDAAASETESIRVYCGDFNVADMLRAFAARLREGDVNAKDAARYRWLRDCYMKDPDFYGDVLVENIDGSALDAAIDAAMREQGEG